jgi:hypothetical protein
MAALLENVPQSRMFDEMIKLLQTGHSLASLEELRKQPKGKTNEWLANWCFDQDGAMRLRAPAKPEANMGPTLENVLAELGILQLVRHRTFH